MTSFPLEGDGVVENLNHLLWTKVMSQDADGNDVAHTCPNVLIPDTLLYKYRQPAYWFYSSMVDGQIRKRSKNKLNNQGIYDGFVRKSDKNDTCELVAFHIARKPQVNEDDPESATIEYLDQDSLNDFLFHRKKINDGMLQKFVPPKGKHNFIIRAIWSPRVCLIEKRINKLPLRASRYDLYERAVTYDGLEHQCYTVPMRGDFIASRIQTICHNIVRHVAHSTHNKTKIIRMVLHFKVSPDDKLWLLWCSSLRVQPSTILTRREVPTVPLNISRDLFVPEKVMLEASTGTQGSPICLVRSFECPNCKKLVQPDRVHPIQYSAIITGFDEMRRTSNLKSEREQVVPPSIQAAHSTINEKKYNNLKTNLTFRWQRVKVCDLCFLRLNKFKEEAMLKSSIVQANGGKEVPLAIHDPKAISDHLRNKELAKANMDEPPPRPKTTLGFATNYVSPYSTRKTDTPEPKGRRRSPSPGEDSDESDYEKGGRWRTPSPDAKRKGRSKSKPKKTKEQRIKKTEIQDEPVVLWNRPAGRIDDRSPTKKLPSSPSKGMPSEREKERVVVSNTVMNLTTHKASAYQERPTRLKALSNKHQSRRIKDEMNFIRHTYTVELDRLTQMRDEKMRRAISRPEYLQTTL